MLIDVLAVGVTYAVIGLHAWPLGLHLARVYTGRPTFPSPVLRPVERGVYRLAGVRESDDQRWPACLLDRKVAAANRFR